MMKYSGILGADPPSIAPPSTYTYPQALGPVTGATPCTGSSSVGFTGRTRLNV